jgi:hypothetical protein
LLGDLDELADPMPAYSILERPSSSARLAWRPLNRGLVRKLSPISSLVLTFGCKFACPYCPIPAYNQRQHRVKSGQRIAEEMHRLYTEYGLRHFFGADDNFFNTRERTLEIVETLARAQFNGRPLRKWARWGTEATVHDTLVLRDHLATVRSAGVRALWLGVEDMTATLVRKGQSVDKTTEAFLLLRRHGINPMPMMMHHDTQPLYTHGKPYGLLNQARLLRKAGAISLQVLMLVPATGTRLYEGTYTEGMAYASVGGRKVEPHMLGGNYVIASIHPQPWRKQLNLLAAYLYFYNPLHFALALLRPKSKLYLADALMQLVGMHGLLQTARRTMAWAVRLFWGRITRFDHPPGSRVPVRSPQEATAPVRAACPAPRHHHRALTVLNVAD